VTTRVLPASIADQVVGIMGTVVTQGTARRAALADGQFAAGKTGTTENDGDAWFVGFTQRMTVAVWVGYPDKLKPMLTEFAGQPVEGGTYPALVWHDFMTAANQVLDDRAAQLRIKQGLPPKPQTTPTSPVPPTSVPAKPAPVPEGGASAPPAPTATTTTPPSGGTGTGTSTTPTTPTTPATPPAPAPTPPPTTTTPPPTAPPSGGTGAGGAGAATEPAGAPPPSP
jgi:penicillin-binding protein 1A